MHTLEQETIVRAEILSVSREEIDELRELQRRNSPFNFSCQPDRRVFVPTGAGYTPPAQRIGRYVDGNRVLDFIASIFKQHDWRCGRFHLDEDGAYLSRDDTQIVKFSYDY